MSADSSATGTERRSGAGCSGSRVPNFTSSSRTRGSESIDAGAHLEGLAARLAFEALRGVVGDDLAVVDDRDLVGEGIRLFQVLGGEQDGGALLDQHADHVPHVVALGRVEARGRLVEVDDAGRPISDALRSSRRRMPPE